MSIIANFDINLRGNTEGVDKAADNTAKKVADLRKTVDTHGSGISERFADLGSKVKAAFAAFPGASVITATLAPAAFLGGAIGKAFASSVAGIGSATTAMGAFGAATTIATAGLNLIVAAVAATGAAAIGAGMAWTGLGLASMGGIKDAQKAADKLGMSVEAVQGFAFKARMDVEELSGLLLKMEKNIGEGNSGAFAKLGLDAEKLKKSRPEDAVHAIADAFNGIGNQTDRVALSMEVFGKQGASALKLLKGGSEGIKQSLAEAKALGIVTSAAESRQVAEAAGALKLMKTSMSGLGKVAAITIAPFVKMIADAITSAMKWINQYRDGIIEFGYNVEFVFRNFGGYAELYFNKASLKVIKWANDLQHIFTVEVPTFVRELAGLLKPGLEHLVDIIASYMAAIGQTVIHLFTEVIPEVFKNWKDLAKGAFMGDDAALDKALAAIGAKMTRQSSDLENILNDDAERSGKIFDRAMERAGKAIKDSMNRGKGPIEEAMEHLVGEQEAAIEKRRQQFLEDKKKSLNIGMSATSSEAVGSKESGAVERGSVEAFKIIAGDREDKIYKVANQQLAELVKIRDELKSRVSARREQRVGKARL